jgi:hypothetical protein
MQGLIIPFNDIIPGKPLVYVGDHARLSTVTSVVFLSPTLIACSHFNDCCMYLISFNLHDKTYKVLQTLDTTFQGKKCETDLLASDNKGNIIATNFNQNTCSLYRHDNNQIKFISDLPYDAGNRVHGLRFVNNDIVAVTCRHTHRGIHFFNIKTFQREALFYVPEISVQDLCLLSNDAFVMITGFGTPTLAPKKIYSSRVSLVKFNIKENKFIRIKDCDYEAAHFDNIINYKGVLYITDQYNNKVLMLNAQSLETKGELVDYDFPHGIDVNYDMIAVTNYGNNSIVIKPLESF